MLNEMRMKGEDFAILAATDAKIARAVAAERCPHCKGPLHQGNYHRKPRGGALAEAGEAFTLRYSLCCGRRGCRRRVLPPSLRFLGRRVYLEMVLILASVQAQVLGATKVARAVTGVPEWTLRRWGSWWRTVLPSQDWWSELRARFVPPPPDERELPRSLLKQIAEDTGASDRDALGLCARCLAPGTTRLRDAARFVRGVAAEFVAG
jgi:hypothetical protein